MTKIDTCYEQTTKGNSNLENSKLKEEFKTYELEDYMEMGSEQNNNVNRK